MTFSSIACVGIPFIGAGLLRRTKSRNATALLWLTTTIVFGLSILLFKLETIHYRYDSCYF